MANLSRRALLRGEFQPKPQPGLAMVGAACLASRGIYCRSCVESCEPGALSIRPALGGRAHVAIDAALCTGCGECVSICPAEAIALRASAQEARHG
ncbi:4Fe-4S dicluster domain-containing protein [Jiella marina]|uniref:4Fe-4S dicluster domain-containing protein n=1 Tax=Jiella sp. LLJ827 TaxID=2917712 RepID=UPI0021006970|nr:4Fe-4S dicluster domain-containing protein [Jiella sp. LLJ827]MCQ0988819.1 4Fe-4S binding protein [Jiella sp. LLJ827]